MGAGAAKIAPCAPHAAASDASATGAVASSASLPKDAYGDEQVFDKVFDMMDVEMAGHVSCCFQCKATGMNVDHAPGQTD